MTAAIGARLHSLTGNLSFCGFLVPVLALLVAEGQASAIVLAGAAALGLLVLLVSPTPYFANALRRCSAASSMFWRPPGTTPKKRKLSWMRPSYWW